MDPQHAGLFDVSHMGPSFWCSTRSQAIQRPTIRRLPLVEPLSAAISRAEAGRIRYTLLLNGTGGPGRSDRAPGLGQTLYVVVSRHQGRRFRRIAAAPAQASSPRRLLRPPLLRGEASGVADLVPEAAELGFMTYSSFSSPFDARHRRPDTPARTASDLVKPAHAAAWDRLLADGRVSPRPGRPRFCGSSRSPLYGHDLDGSISPTEAGLNASQRRREWRSRGGHVRFSATSRLRVGIQFDGRCGARARRPRRRSGCEMGHVTSGGFSPTLSAPIAGLPPGTPTKCHVTPSSVTSRSSALSSGCPIPIATSASPAKRPDPDLGATKDLNTSASTARPDGQDHAYARSNWATSSSSELPSVGRRSRRATKSPSSDR
jgi:aminomethyltransferase